MKKTHSIPIPIEHSLYHLHVTEEFDRSMKEAKDILKETQTDEYVDKWQENIRDHLRALSRPKEKWGRLGKINPKHFSDTYAYQQVSGTKTTIFFLVEKDQIYLATSGYSAAPWRTILEENRAKIERSINKLKAQKKAIKPNQQAR